MQFVKEKKLIFNWVVLYLFFGLVGLLVGMNAIIPGPTSKNALLTNPGERLAIEHGMAPTDGFLVMLSKKTPEVSEETFDVAVKDLVTSLKEVKTADGTPLFGLIQSSIDTMALDNSKFISSDKTSRIVIAGGKLPVFDSPKEFLTVPKTLEVWAERFPQFSYGYVSNSTGEDEVFKLVSRDLDRSLIFTTPLTIGILVWAFRSWIAAMIPMLIAGISLVGALGVSAIVSNFISGISVTAGQLVVLLVLAIGVDYSLFFLTRAREEKAKGLSDIEAIKNTERTTGVAILWSGLIVSVSMVGLMLISDTVLNSMSIVAIIAVLLTLASCAFVLPKILLIFGKCLVSKNLDDSGQFSRRFEGLINFSLERPKVASIVIVSFLLFLSSYSFQINLGNTMIPEILPKTLQGMSMYVDLEKKFPEITGGDASIILTSDNLEELEESGDLELALDKLRSTGLRGPFKIERSSDFTFIRYKFLTNGYGDDLATQNYIDEVKDKILPEIFSPLGVNAFLSGVVEHSVSEAHRYKSKMGMVFGSVLLLSFLFLLVAFRSIVIPLKAILLNLLSTTASFGILVLVFQVLDWSPFRYGVIESFVPPLLFTILFGLSMDYHVFMLSRISEEFHKSGNTKEAVLLGIRYTSKTITSAALIMISVFFVAATLELPVMKQLGIGLGVAVLIDATLIRAILLPATMVLLGRWNWYLPGFLSFIPNVKIEGSIEKR